MDPAAPETERRARLGPFVLERPIGSGGMGEVWRAVHATERLPVAIKVIGPRWAREASYRAAFQREVRAVAGLLHPGIVSVHDQGVVGAAAARATGLAAESPYLVMEYMPRGSLEGLLAAIDWPLLQVLTRAILAALAHAHARGVVHCDLKPGNVLLSGTAQVAIKLTDFGVAHALAPSGSLPGDAPRSAGTPAYMAPEQLLGQWRSFGPWTDLYALGCMIWELCCGQPPFVAHSLGRLAAMHLHEAPGEFTPAFAAPAGLEGWVRRLLSKRPEGRFQCAADAAWALERLGEGPATMSWAAVAERALARKQQAQRTTARSEFVGVDGSAGTRMAEVDGSAGTRMVGDIEGGVDGSAGTRMAGASEAGVDAAAGTRMAGELGSAGTRMAGELGSAGTRMGGELGSAGTLMALGSAGTRVGGELGSAGTRMGGELGSAGTLMVELGSAGTRMGGELGSAGTLMVGEGERSLGAFGDVDAAAEEVDFLRRTLAAEVAGAGAGAATVAAEVARAGDPASDRTVAVGVVAHGMSDGAGVAGFADMSRRPGAAGFGDMSLRSGPAVSGDMLDRAGRAAAGGDAPPLPASWRGPGDAVAVGPLAGAGLTLYRFREVPLVGREAERDALWAALARVHAEGRPRGLLVRGASGVGKSRIVEWLATRAHELGAATVLRADHGPFGGRGEGLPRMLAAHLQCVGLAGDEVYARVLAGLEESDVPGDRSGAVEEAAALTEYMLPGEDGERPRVRLAEQRERHAVLAGYLRRLTAERPALLWLDDAMWGPEALDFARYLLARGDGPRALLVLTVRDDVVAERPAEARLIEELAALPGMSVLEVAPLAEAEHRALIHERLGLDAALVEAVLARAGGNPLFSVQLVGDWVTRGLLTPGPAGFALPPEVSLELPEDLQTLWQERLTRLLDQHYAPDEAAAARQALELAAALGLEVDPQAWARGCAIEGLTPPAGLVELLLAQRLAVPTRGGWAFVHGMLRESLEDLAAERRTLHHRTCAQILRALHGERAQGHAEEVARHLIAAGDRIEALAPLLDATYEMQLAGQYERAERVLDEHAALADRVGLALDDARRLRGRMQAVWLTWMRGADGSLALARARCREVESVARRAGHDDVLGEALRWHGLVGRFERRFDESLAALEQAAAAFRRAGDVGGEARTALARAVTLRALGELDAAERELADARRHAEACGLTVLLPRIAGNLAELALQRGDWSAAGEWFARALAAAESVGDRKAQALTRGGAGDLALQRGLLDEAEEHYARAEALFASLGSRYVHGVRVNRATLTLLRGGLAQAQRFMAEFVATPGRDALYLAQAYAGLALCAAHDGRWPGFDDALQSAQEQIAAARERRPIVGLLLGLASEVAGRAGQALRAERAGASARAP